MVQSCAIFNKMWWAILVMVVPWATCTHNGPGPKYPPTKGEVWPRPKYQEKLNSYYKLEPNQYFKVLKSGKTCDILEKAISRYLLDDLKIKFSYLRMDQTNQSQTGAFFKGKLNRNFKIRLTSTCEKYPHFYMNETYSLTIGKVNKLSSNSIWGILHGLETFSQLLYYDDGFTALYINETTIMDYPSYRHRGLLIDTGRHFLKKSTILSMLDAMAVNKMNVLHWHITDDESFPYHSKQFPELSKGAFHPSMVYRRSDIQDIVEHARIRGVRVIPEFDIPDHANSWGVAHPELLIECKNGLGTLNPTASSTFEFLFKLYQEVSAYFPDKSLHIGGDEVDQACWMTYLFKRHQSVNMPEVTNDIKLMYKMFIENVIDLLPAETQVIVWEEVFNANINISRNIIVQVWRYNYDKKMHEILNAGGRLIFSSEWYLDYLERTWEIFYETDPRQVMFKKGQDYPLENIVGGEACIWGEKADDTNILSKKILGIIFTRRPSKGVEMFFGRILYILD